MPQEIKMEVLLYILKFSHALKIWIDCMCVVGICACVFQVAVGICFQDVRTLMCMWKSEDNFSYLSISAI